MRALAWILTASLVGGCYTTSHRVPVGELARLTQLPPEQRGQRVRVIQDIGEDSAPEAQAVGPSTQLVIVPQINISTGVGVRPRGSGGGSSSGGLGGKQGGKASDGKAEAIAVVVIAALAVVIVAGIEGSRFDGWAQLHPMHPVHLYGKDGGYAVVPLAALDAPTVAWTDRAVVRSSEGPWLDLERAPLSREGFTYSMYGGSGSLESKFGDKQLGPAFTIQGGYFPSQMIGVNLTTFFGWRDNRVGETLYESRYTLELQGFPVQAGPFHAGLFGGVGLAYRWEDGIVDGNRGQGAGSTALVGGAMLQLDINTRIALTVRFGVTRAHAEEMNDVQFGLSVY